MLAAVALPTSVRAQAGPGAPAREIARAAGPRVSPAAFTWGVEANALDRITKGPQDRPHVGQDVAMMGAGAAAIVVGSLIGGDGGMVIALGGGVIGVIGLYHYLR
jgi:hypothetical protein